MNATSLQRSPNKPCRFTATRLFDMRKLNPWRHKLLSMTLNSLAVLINESDDNSIEDIERKRRTVISFNDQSKCY